jgi:hypothetical protein
VHRSGVKEMPGNDRQLKMLLKGKISGDVDAGDESRKSGVRRRIKE